MPNLDIALAMLGGGRDKTEQNIDTRSPGIPQGACGFIKAANLW